MIHQAQSVSVCCMALFSGRTYEQNTIGKSNDHQIDLYLGGQQFLPNIGPKDIATAALHKQDRPSADAS